MSVHSDLCLVKDKVVPKAALTFKTQLTAARDTEHKTSLGFFKFDVTKRYLPLGSASTHSYELMTGDLLYGVLLPS